MPQLTQRSHPRHIRHLMGQPPPRILNPNSTLSTTPDCKRALARNERNPNIANRSTAIPIDSSDQYLNQLVCGVEKVERLQSDMLDIVRSLKDTTRHMWHDHFWFLSLCHYLFPGSFCLVSTWFGFARTQRSRGLANHAARRAEDLSTCPLASRSTDFCK
jgi:hypothetical protein